MGTAYTPVGGAAPIAQGLQGLGRGNDSMLMHVTPGEVQGLQALAQQYGGSLTTNPQTGLPEAGFLESILPMLAGGLLTMTGIGAPLAAALVGGGTGLITGDLKQGLMAGLGAFGGAGLAGALGAAGAGAGAAASNLGALGSAAGQTAAGVGAGGAGAAGAAGVGATGTAGSLGALGQAAATGAPSLATITPAAATIAPAAPTLGALGSAVGQAATGAATQGMGIAPAIQGAAAKSNMVGQLFGPKAGQIAAGFGDATAIQGIPRASTTAAAAMGVGAPIMDAMAPEPYMPPEEKSNYAGPYRPTDRRVRFRGPNANLGDSSEFSYFDNTNPYPGFEPAPQGYLPQGYLPQGYLPQGYAQGGPVSEPGPSILPVQQVQSPPVSAEGVPLGMLTSGPGAAASPDRALRRPGSDYKAGMQAEHNWNFRPISQPTDMMPLSYMRSGSGSGFNMDMLNTDMMSALNPGGKGLGALMAAMRDRDIPVDYGPPRSFQYDPRTQSVSDMQGFASGGVALKDGAFVMDARTVSEMGNGSSGAGQELLARHGGKPIRGPGDGVSDSIPARLGKQPARVARDEVKFDPEAVRRIGGGNPRKGAQRLYELMDKAHKARRTASRGTDTKLRKAL